MVQQTCRNPGGFFCISFKKELTIGLSVFIVLRVLLDVIHIKHSKNESTYKCLA
ncbi:protein of unknown function [Bacillus velezensis]|nr:protein of unknown function [Bacillus velezensis]